jgi:hypothetical protein
MVGAAVVCQGCQSPALSGRPFAGASGLVPAPGSFPVPSGQGGLDACAGPRDRSAPSLSTQPSCSQGGRSGVRVMAGSGPLTDVPAASAVGAAASRVAGATGGSQPGTESPA